MINEILKEDLILHSSAIINGKNGDISLFKDRMIWHYFDQFEKITNNLLLNDIISIQDNCDFFLKSRLIQSPKIISKTSEKLKKLRMVLYSVVLRSNGTCQWNILSTTVSFDDESHCTRWKETIHDLLHFQNDEYKRPKSLAVFINPIGGFKKAVELYNAKVKPIFDLAGIKTYVTVTSKRDEAKEYILSQKLQKVDGLVCVGGDGMLMELIHGLLMKARIDAGHSEDDHFVNSPEFPSILRVGIIPAGSTDSVAYSTIGTKDVITSTLHIVKGSSIALDTMTVHADNTFLRYNVSLMGYGFYGNCISESETLRWMGPKRYDWLGFKHFMSLTTYYGELRYLPVQTLSGNPRDGKICEERCSNCATFENEETLNNKKWVTIRDRFVAINSFLISCRCRKSPLGPAPYAHLGNGCSDLVIVRDCNRFKFLQHLLKSASSGDPFDFDFIQTVRVSEFSFKPLENGSPLISKDGSSNHNSVWNCDGEPIYSPNVTCKVHRKMIRLFANGIPNIVNMIGSVKSLSSEEMA